jgi:hypothetical protein
VDRHAGANDDDVVVAEGGDGLAEAVVGVRVLAVEQRDLNERAVERVLFGTEGYVEAREDAVVEAALEALGLDPRVGKQGEDAGGQCRAALAGEGGFVVLGWEAVEAGRAC